MLGCGGDGDDNNKGGAAGAAAARATLENKTFTFADGAVFGLAGQAVTLTFGNFDADGDRDPSTGPFTLQAGGNRAAGSVKLGSCRYTVASSTAHPGGIPAGNSSQFVDYCSDCGRSAPGGGQSGSEQYFLA
jgi:hypothetical protein